MSLEALLLQEMLRASARPDNFFILRNELEWKKLYTSCSEKNAILCLEFHDNSFAACRNVSKYFIELAGNYNDVPFLKISLTNQEKWIVVRKSVGGVDYVPALVVMFFAPDGAERAKFEGDAQIELAIRRGSLKNVIEQFRRKRQVLENINQLGNQMAKNLLSMLIEGVEDDSDNENDKKQKQLQLQQEEEKKEQEKNSQMLKKHEQKIQRERLHSEEKAKQEQLSTEEKKRNRPVILEELKKQGELNSLPVKKLKGYLAQLHINTVGLYEKTDLVTALLDEFPELKHAQIKKHTNPIEFPSDSYSVQNESSIKPKTDSNSIANLSDEQIENLSTANLKYYINQYGISLGPFSERQDLIDTIKIRRNTISTVPYSPLPSPIQDIQTSFSVGTPNKGNLQQIELNEITGQLLECKDQLRESKILSTCQLSNFIITDTINVHKDRGSIHVVMCKKEGLPYPNKKYTLKGVFNYFATINSPTSNRVKQEIEILSAKLPYQSNIISHCATFFDFPNDLFVQGCLNVVYASPAMFSLIEHHQCIKTYLAKNHSNEPVKTLIYLDWIEQIIAGFKFLLDHSVVLRSITTDTILYDYDAKQIKLAGFDYAIQSSVVPFTSHDTVIGDLNSYLPPEILNSSPGAYSKLDYSQHYPWTVGCLAYEIACNPCPFIDNINPSNYTVDKLPPLKYIYTFDTLTRTSWYPLPPEFTVIVQKMLKFHPSDRPKLDFLLTSLEISKSNV